MLRVSVEGGGCSGFQYKFDIERAKADDDLVIARDGATVLIDPVSVGYMAGSEIDFVDDLIGAVVQGEQSEGHRVLRLRHQLLAVISTSFRGAASRSPRSVSLHLDLDRAPARVAMTQAIPPPPRRRLRRLPRAAARAGA